MRAPVASRREARFAADRRRPILSPMARDSPDPAQGTARPRLGRRALLAGAAASAGFCSSLAWADADPDWRPRDLDVREVKVPGTLSQLFVLATPRHLESYERVPLVVLLHGLGETGDARMGAWAWLERYGLGTSYDRLRAGGSMRGLVLVCPYMPDLPIADPRAFDDLARRIDGVRASVERQTDPGKLEQALIVAREIGGAEPALLQGGTFGKEFGRRVAAREIPFELLAFGSRGWCRRHRVRHPADSAWRPPRRVPRRASARKESAASARRCRGSA